ncbi:FAD-dependent oxidoreductase [Moorella sulfitireducens]|uniref:FAD-dependent oxidoreductase n=1 Tax=Neomoorella sulfitireducens TaxID=2972948 RepID=UPI0021AC2BA0|nr:FAD-dependent oxidoreductase [Moorella sulfitireducens]
MSGEEKFDVIVVGAGPAGSACACTLAREGKSVLLVERGDTAGAKNVSGGRLYTHALKVLGDEFVREAAVERRVTREEIMVLSGDRAVTIDYHDPSFNREGEVPQSYTVLRAVLDGWLAGKAEEAGAIVACGIKVDDVIEENGRIAGVKAGEDEVYADVVVAADGVNSILAQKAGLIGDIAAVNVAVGVKEIIALPPKVIEERFGVRGEEGTALLILGCTEGIKGGGFLYTNKESISLGCVVAPEEVAGHGKPVHRIFQELKMHPAVYPLIEGGETVEYGAHLVGEAGYRGVPRRLYRDGFLVTGDSAGFVVNLGYTIRGMDLAVLSGVAAARAVLSETKPERVGSAYMQELENLKVLPTMKAVQGYVDLLDTPRLYEQYPRFIINVFRELFTVDGSVPPSLRAKVKAAMRDGGPGWWQVIKDGLRGLKN